MTIITAQMTSTGMEAKQIDKN